MQLQDINIAPSYIPYDTEYARLEAKEKRRTRRNELQKQKAMYFEWECTKVNNGIFWSRLRYKNVYSFENLNALNNFRQRGLSLKDSPNRLVFSFRYTELQYTKLATKFANICFSFKNDKVYHYLYRDNTLQNITAESLLHYFGAPLGGQLRKDIAERVFEKAKENGINLHYRKEDQIHQLIFRNIHKHFNNCHLDYSMHMFHILKSVNKCFKVKNSFKKFLSLLPPSSCFITLKRKPEYNFNKVRPNEKIEKSFRENILKKGYIEKLSNSISYLYFESKATMFKKFCASLYSSYGSTEEIIEEAREQKLYNSL